LSSRADAELARATLFLMILAKDQLTSASNRVPRGINVAIAAERARLTDDSEAQWGGEMQAAPIFVCHS
jgi:hypothetical protein